MCRVGTGDWAADDDPLSTVAYLQGRLYPEPLLPGFDYAARMAAEMGFDEERIEDVRAAALGERHLANWTLAATCFTRRRS